MAYPGSGTYPGSSTFPGITIADTAPDVWFKADAITGLSDGAAVGTWADSSGNAKDATQSVAGDKPLFKTGIVGALPGVLFDGATDRMYSNASGSAAAQTILAVVKPLTSGANRTISGTTNNGVQFRLGTGEKVETIFEGTTGLSVGSRSVSANAVHVLSATYNAGANGSIRTDGVNDVYATGSTVGGSTTILLGSRGNLTEFFNGYMFEYVRWNRVLSAAEIVAVEAELASKWGGVALAGHDAATAVTATASSTASGWDAWKLFDGTVGSGSSVSWSAQANPPAWVKAQFNAAINAATYSVSARTDNTSQAPTAWTLEGSNDNTTWATLDTQSGLTWSAGETKTFTPPNTGKFKYYRMTMTAPIQWLSFSEWRLSQAVTVVSTPVDGVVAAVSSTDGAVTARVGADGAVAVVSGSDGAASAAFGLGGAVAAVSDVQGLLVSGVDLPLDGQADAASGVDGVLGLALTAAGQVDAVSAVEGDMSVASGLAGQVSATSGVLGYLVGAALGGTEVAVGVKVEVGALTLLNLVALPGVEIEVGATLEAGDSAPVVPLPGVNIAVGASLEARPVELLTVDPRHKRAQWRYVITDLANTPLGELVDIQHEPVADGINTPTTMRFTMAADDPARSLIEAGGSMTRKCQVWAGNQLLLWGPLLSDQQSDNGTAGYTVHDPSWYWRGGRRVIGRLPRKNLLRNGDFKQGLTYWESGFDKDSIPAAKPNVRVVSEDFLEDTDGLDPIRAAEITGVESVTESELSSSAVFWPNLATFRPGGKAAIEAVANNMPETSGLKVTVVGHTANDGTGNGLGLSKRRADAAAAIIHAKRPGAVITTKGVGFYDPKPGFPINSQEQRRVVISYDQTISGKSRQWVKQTIEVTQPKSARYPLELTLAAMLKVADDWSVEDANMVSVRLVVRRKGAAKPLPWDAQLGVGESSISDTDPVDRWIGQSAQATVPADSRAYLVDAYLYAPAALARYTAVGLFPEEELYFWGVDQALIFKGIAEHIQDTSMGHGDLGIETRTPLTGIKRDRTYAFRDHMPADTALEEFAGLNRGMDYDTLMFTDGRVVLSTHYPQQGKHTPYVFVLGGNVANASPERSRDVASSIIMQAQDLGSYRAEAYAKDKRALGGLLLERVVTAEQETPMNELREAARQELAWGGMTTTGYWLDIDPDSIDDVLANTSKGDIVRLILDTPVAVDGLARIINRERHPDSLRLLVALEQEV